MASISAPTAFPSVPACKYGEGFLHPFASFFSRQSRKLSKDGCLTLRIPASAVFLGVKLSFGQLLSALGITLWETIGLLKQL